MYETPLSVYTDDQVKEQMHHFLMQLANVDSLGYFHQSLILKYLDIISREESLKQ